MELKEFNKNIHIFLIVWKKVIAKNVYIPLMDINNTHKNYDLKIIEARTVLSPCRFAINHSLNCF